MAVRSRQMVDEQEFKDGGIKIPQLQNKRVGLVIGNDYYSLLHPTDSKNLHNGMTLIRNKLGWFCYGGKKNAKLNVNCNMAIKNPKSKEMKISIEDEILSKRFENKTIIEDEKIVAPLLINEVTNGTLKEFCPRKTAENRLLQQLKAFKKNPDLEKEYDERIYE
ncbi:unnamed protein product [Dimorphilus gyrociliatus]|uniref:Uncharacterized protein n=1 Tax=Dimorphilus gyrociliatus TaxID=2664684 RepID=A0A7I8WBB1_9ANNE|nr:unnamed protein product [Dimorphilus gyrociliatus]